MVLYAKSDAVPPFLHVSLALSKRMHSIYVLRLFNDCWTMLFAYGALYLLMSRRVAASIATFSLAVSTKMNVLLFAPGVLVVCLLVRVNPPEGHRRAIAPQYIEKFRIVLSKFMVSTAEMQRSQQSCRQRVCP